MTANRRTARALALVALASTAAGLYAASLVNLWLALPGLYAAAVLAWCSNRYYAAHHRQVAEEAWEERHVLGECPAPLDPCCALARHSGGAAHDRRKCTDLFHRITADLTADHATRSSL
ncbi:hypothetical protein K4B79_18820 [Streptomyces lincolnensis]|uniref:hypothetical protein n=1 Tax=Streptomyces lincolnensis TaxID=1915 RepID=UPI001E4788AB|nr:hypothetical protein [Streptomyces lincolnensis]MCD7440269.1 hypothetical protein [Streptomyces lincolnensis]